MAVDLNTVLGQINDCVTNLTTQPTAVIQYLQGQHASYTQIMNDLVDQPKFNSWSSEYKKALLASMEIDPALLALPHTREKVQKIMSQLEQAACCIRCYLGSAEENKLFRYFAQHQIETIKAENRKLSPQGKDIKESQLKVLEQFRNQIDGERTSLIQRRLASIRGLSVLSQAHENERLYFQLLNELEQNFNVNMPDDFWIDLWAANGRDIDSVRDAFQERPRDIHKLRSLIWIEIGKEKAMIDTEMRSSSVAPEWVFWSDLLTDTTYLIGETKRALAVLNSESGQSLQKRAEILANDSAWPGDAAGKKEVQAAADKYNQYKNLNAAFKDWLSKNPAQASVQWRGGNFIFGEMKRLFGDEVVPKDFEAVLQAASGNPHAPVNITLQQLSDFLQKQEEESFKAVSKLISEGKIGPDLAEDWKENEKEIEYHSKVKNFEEQEKILLADRKAFLDKLMGRKSLPRYKEMADMITQLEMNQKALEDLIKDSTAAPKNHHEIERLLGPAGLIAGGPLEAKLAELASTPTATISTVDLIKLLQADQKYILDKINKFINDQTNPAGVSTKGLAEWNKINAELKQNSDQLQRRKDDHNRPAQLKISHTDFKAVMAVLNGKTGSPAQLPHDTTYTPVDKDDIYKGGTLEPKPGTGSYTAKFENDGNVKITGKDAHTKGVGAVLAVFKAANIKAVDIDCPKTGGKENEAKMLAVIKATLAQGIAPVMKKGATTIPANETLEFILKKAKTDPTYTPVAHAYATAVMKSGDTALMAQLTQDLPVAEQTKLQAIPPNQRGKAIVDAVIQDSVDKAPKEKSAVNRVFGTPPPGLTPAAGSKSPLEHLIGRSKPEEDGGITPSGPGGSRT